VVWVMMVMAQGLIRMTSEAGFLGYTIKTQIVYIIFG
jgi:hypothetical protein